MNDPETQDTVQIKKNSTEKTEWSMENERSRDTRHSTNKKNSTEKTDWSMKN